jgi:MurNAc alpha-1-phosphate uridylyltransferase
MKTAMILAAGRGERLRPLTLSRPKALCCVNHTPLIDYHVSNLVAAGFDHLVINHAYLGGQIRQHLGNGSRWGICIEYSPEPPGALETGGGIVNALPLLGKQPFLTVNADIFTDFCFDSIQLPSTSLAHLILVNKPSYFNQGDFGLSPHQQLMNIPKVYTYTGIAAYNPVLFESWKPGRYSITPLLRQLALEGLATGECYEGHWVDIGSPERLIVANNYFK